MSDRNNLPLNKFGFSAGRSVTFKNGASDLTVESAEDQISVMSGFNITRDAAGLSLARDLVDIFLGAIQTLKDDQQAGRLPQEFVAKAPVVRDNPLQ
jgi:hypothetical protein